MRKLVLAFVLAALAAAVPAGAATPTLQGTVGPGFTISLKQNGKVVKTLPAGTYKLVIADKASFHNFVLQRQGKAAQALTTVPFTGSKTVTVKLTKGKWEFYCAPHQSVMHGQFSVS